MLEILTSNIEFELYRCPPLLQDDVSSFSIYSSLPNLYSLPLTVFLHHDGTTVVRERNIIEHTNLFKVKNLGVVELWVWLPPMLHQPTIQNFSLKLAWNLNTGCKMALQFVYAVHVFAYEIHTHACIYVTWKLTKHSIRGWPCWIWSTKKEERIKAIHVH